MYLCSAPCTLLPKLLGMPHNLALYTESMLRTYYKTFKQPKKVIKDISMYGIIQSFKLPSEVGDELLCVDAPNNELLQSPTVLLLPKDDADSTMLDLGK